MSYLDDERFENEDNLGQTSSSSEQTSSEPAESANDRDDSQKSAAYGVAYTPDGECGYRYTAYTANSAFTPAGANAPKAKKSYVVPIVALIAVLGIILSAIAGFGGVYLAKTFLASGETTGVTGEPINPGSSSGIIVSTPNGSVTNAPTSVERGELMSYADAAAKVKDSVVEITTEATVQGGGYYQQYITSGAGSGVIITSDGYIVTNNHVISGAEKITVRLTSGKEFEAVLVGADARTDVAVIKISPEDTTLTVAAFTADSATLVVGTEVLAIGNPLGELGGTVTNGIISALEREVKIDGSGTMVLLQTNAAVNPGNSGGGLFNLYGELVGVVNAKSSGNNVEGLGFAIPANTVRSVASQLMEFGYIKGRPSIGVTVLDLDAYSAYYYFRTGQAGVYIVESKDPVLKYGDRIIAVANTEIADSEDIGSIIDKYEIGEAIEVMIVRDRKTMTVSVTLTEFVPELSK